MIIKKNKVRLTVHFRNGEVFILSDAILTAFDFTTRSLSSSEATLANGHMKNDGGNGGVEELKSYFRGRAWEVLEG